MATPDSTDFVRPPPVQSSFAVRVFSPGGAIEDEQLKAGRSYLEDAGFVVDQPPTVTERFNYFAGNSASRAKELYDAVMTPVKGRDSSSNIIWAARGGYGSSQLVEEGLTAEMLDDLCRDLLQNPRWLVGYSDVTVLSLHLWVKARVLVLHGPMVVNITQHNSEALAEMWSLLRGSEPHTQVFAGDVRYGKGAGSLARGRLLGGNIQVIASLLGAKDKRGQALLPPLDCCILLLEEVGEPAYRIHRTLCALFRSPCIGFIVGIAFGQLTSADKYSGGLYTSLETLDELLEPLGIPIITGIDIGHETATARPIVLGAEAEIHGSGQLRVFVPGCDKGTD